MILSKLEIMLPIYWNTSTRHFLLHTYDFIRECGHFWAFSMLGVERIHVMIKKLGKSKRNLMKSLQKNNDRLVQSQLNWRYNPHHKWSTKGRGASFQEKQPIPEHKRIVLPRGGLTKVKVNPQIFQFLENEWAVKKDAFFFARERYYRYVTHCEEKDAVCLTLPDWLRRSGQHADAKRYFTV